jgi:NADP-dependent 3-hydroxy acid dehydrogenase YdfG
MRNNNSAAWRLQSDYSGTHGELSTPTKVGQMTTPSAPERVAVVTGASAGIGEATARTLAAQDFHVVCVARREGPIKALAAEIGGTAIVADVTSDADVSALADALNRVDVLVNNAGGARGLEPVADADLDNWRWMWEANVLGTLRVTRALLPKLIDSGDGLIVTVTSIAAVEIYDGGSGYTAAKHAQGVLHRTLRSELLGKPVRLTEVAPGMVKTDFSLRRFEGDEERAAKVYEGVTPLVAEDIAEVIGFVASRPSHVDLDLIVVRPRDQVSGASGSRFNRQVAR